MPPASVQQGVAAWEGEAEVFEGRNGGGGYSGRREAVEGGRVHALDEEWEEGGREHQGEGGDRRNRHGRAEPIEEELEEEEGTGRGREREGSKRPSRDGGGRGVRGEEKAGGGSAREEVRYGSSGRREEEGGQHQGDGDRGRRGYEAGGYEEGEEGRLECRGGGRLLRVASSGMRDESARRSLRDDSRGLGTGGSRGRGEGEEEGGGRRRGEEEERYGRAHRGACVLRAHMCVTWYFCTPLHVLYACVPYSHACTQIDIPTCTQTARAFNPDACAT